ncbi:MAG: hypothetical protein RR178_05210 [Gordonibacter sp.]
MLLTEEEYESYGLDPADKSLPRKLSAIEHKIRAHTNCRFQVRPARIETLSTNGRLAGVSPYIKVGDTVEVSASGVNDGLYAVASVAGDTTVLDRELFDAPLNRMTLVRYPPDVIAGAVGILEYEKSIDGKQGLASESLSRRSVTYVQPAQGSSLAGYPLSITAFLKPYMRATF